MRRRAKKHRLIVENEEYIKYRKYKSDFSKSKHTHGKWKLVNDFSYTNPNRLRFEKHNAWEIGDAMWGSS